MILGKFKQIIKHIKENIKTGYKTSPHVFEWSVLILFSVLCFSIFLYPDIIETSNHSLKFWDAFFKDGIRNFYKLNYSDLSKAVYEIPIYIIFAIWNIPLYIIHSISKVDIFNHLSTVLYLKSILFVFIIFILFVMKKIASELEIDKKNIVWIVFLFLSSPILFMTIYMFGGYDIISVLFTLIGILMYIRGDNKKFILFFSIAISLKLFPIFIFIPLIILKEKNPLKIITNLFLGFGVTIFCKLLFYNAPLYMESTKSFSDGMLMRLFSSTYPGGLVQGSYFILIFTLLCIFCYWKKISSKKELMWFVLYIPIIVYGFMYAFVASHPQWLILMLPYLILAIFNNKQNIRLNLILEIALSASMIFIMITYWRYVFDTSLLNDMIISKNFMTGLSPASPNDIYMKFDIIKFQPAMLSIYMACLISMVVINYPRNNALKKEKINGDNIVENRILLWMRLLIILPFTITILYCYFK